MGVFFRRRRPVMRVAAGAATAGVAYKAGKRRSQKDQTNQQAQEASESTQTAQTAQPAAQQPAAQQPATQPQGASSGSMNDLDRLVQLHESGALTDDEFSAAKSKLLGL